MEESAIPATMNLLDYFQDKAELDAAPFSADEISHLEDVKGVMDGVLKFLAFFVLVFLFLLLSLKDTKLYLRYSGILAIAIPVILYLIPFKTSFNLFHNIFFPQGNWVFPAGSALVTLYPNSFFYSFAFTTFWWLFVTGWGLLIFSFFVDKMKKFK